MVWPCFCKKDRDRDQACRTEGANSEMLYSRGTPILRGEEARRNCSTEDSSCAWMRLRDVGEMLVGSRGSCRFTMSGWSILASMTDRTQKTQTGRHTKHISHAGRVPAHNANCVQRIGIGNHPPSRDQSVRRLEAHRPRIRRGESNRTARIRPEGSVAISTSLCPRFWP